MTTRKRNVRKKVEGVYHHGDLRSALKAAALRLVLEKGPRGFSINEASRLAGVTVAAPYRHFADKDALLAEIAIDGFAMLATQTQEAAQTDKDPAARMLAAGLAYLRFASRHRDYFAVMFGAGLDKAAYPELRHNAEAAFAVIFDLAQEMERSQEAALRRAISSWSLVHGLATLDGDGLLTHPEKSVDAELFVPILQQSLRHTFSE